MYFLVQGNSADLT